MKTSQMFRIAKQVNPEVPRQIFAEYVNEFGSLELWNAETRAQFREELEELVLEAREAREQSYRNLSEALT
jgi:hypothetical protein